MEKPEINLEKVHLLIDKLKTQVSDSSGAQHLLPTAQMLVAELQSLQTTKRPSGAVCVVMPSGTRPQRTLEQAVSPTINPTENLTLQEDNNNLQPPVTITEQAPEEVIDLHAFREKTAVKQPETTDKQETKMDTSTAAAAESEAENQAPPHTKTQTLTQTQPQTTSTDTAAVKQTPQFNFDSEATSPSQPAPENASTDTRLPTSIPSDEPEIQSSIEETPDIETETKAGINTSTDTNTDNHIQEEAVNPNPTAANTATTAYRAPAPPSHQQPVPADNQKNKESVAPSVETSQNEAASAPAQTPVQPIQPMEEIPSTSAQQETEMITQEPQTDKKRQLDFIHENFSAWSDYGIDNEAPTLIQNKVEPAATETKIQLDLNDQLKEDREEWGHTLQSTPIDNLAAAIGINDRYLFISELFRGDESMYERSILTLNKFQNFDQAHAWSERELRLKLGWDMENPITTQFEQLVKRRFMKKG